MKARMGKRIAALLLMAVLAAMALAQAVTTTTVQGTVYLANGQPGAGMLVVSWPAFTTAGGQAIAADSTTVTIAADGFVSVNLAPNLGATPAGEFYTAVFYLSDGTVNTEYWVVPAAAQASLAQVEAQVMPAAQAVQAVSKAYVDQSIAEMEGSFLTASGGTLTGPLYLNADPTQPMQAATKHYVDAQVATAVPLAGGGMTGALTTPAVNGVEAPAAGSGQTTLQSAMTAAGTNGAMEIPPNYPGTDTFTNPNGVKVTDWRTGVAQQTERSVKEFGAVCDGVTDDTNALTAALSYAHTHGVALTIPEGTCKTRTLEWRGESIGGLGKQVSALMGFPGQDVLASAPDETDILSYTRLHDLTIYVDQSADASCSPAEGRAAAGLCQMSRYMEENSIFSQGGNGLTNTVGTGAGWGVGNCAIAMPAGTGMGGNGLKVAEVENVEIATTGVDPMAAQYPGAHSTHTCGMYLAQWPQWSEFRNIDIRGLNTGIAIPALAVTAPAGLSADSNRWQDVTIQATHGFTAAAGSNDVLDNVVAEASNSAATGEPPTGIVLDLSGSAQGWIARNAVVQPSWIAVPPALTVSASGGAITAVTVGPEQGLGWDPYGTSVPVSFSGSCTAEATAAVNANGSIGNVTVTQGGVGCSLTTTASLNAAGTWDTAAPVNLVGGQNILFLAGNLLKGSGGYTAWNASNSASYGTQLDGGGGTLPGGGTYAALVRSASMGAAFQVDQFPGVDFGGKLQACINAVSASYGGTCDARNFTGNLSMGSNVTIATGNTSVLLPCATIETANQIIVTAGTRNVSLHGCAMRGGSAASGSQGGTAFAYSGTGAMVQVGDPSYVTDTPGFHMDDAVLNMTAAAAATAEGLAAYRTQEMDLEDMYFLGNANQTGMTVDGTGNYAGGTFRNDQFDGFQTAVNAIGHQVANPATTDWMNASTFVRLHIDCPTTSGSPISGTYGINLEQGDGNTFTGGDVEGCSTALHLGPNAQNNTIVGLRNENSTNQVVADAGSSYNNWMTGGTMFTGKLTDNGTRNSFLDTFHRSFNGLTGDWYGSQQDATVTNHYRLGIGAGNERGLLNEIQTDSGYRWLYGFSDASSGQQLYQLQDLLNNVYRVQIQQWNGGQSNTNNQTALNAAGTGNVCFNCSTNSGTGGVSFASGGASPATVATIDDAGDAQFGGTLQVTGTSQSAGTLTVRNNADAEVDYYLWPGLTTSQKGSYTYKDWNGNSQWYMVKDASNNWALNSATGGLDSVKAYQSTNSGDTYIDASNSSGHVRLNYETGSGAETDIYSGSSANLDAAFLGPASIKFPGLAASSGHFCLQVDSSGYLTNTGSACGSGSGSTSGTINSGNSGQIAYYTTNGTTVGGMSAVPVSSGGTGASSAATALANLGGLPASGGTMTGALTATGFVGPLTGNVTGTASGNLAPANNLSDVASAAAAVSNLLPGIAADGNEGLAVQGNVSAAQSIPATSPYADIRAYGAKIDGSTDIGPAVCSAMKSYTSSGKGLATTLFLPCGGNTNGCYWANPEAACSGVQQFSSFKIALQGRLKLGTTLTFSSSSVMANTAPYYIQEVDGIDTGAATQFEASGVPADIQGNGNCYGTLGTAVVSTNSAVTVTPTFNSGCTITNLPANSAITMRALETSTATASATPSGSSGYVTYNTSNPIRISPGTLVTVTGCANSAFNITNAVVSNSDYPNRNLSFYTSNVTSSSTTGCTISGLSDDRYESATVQCSNGTGNTGYSCGSGQITFVPTHTYASTDQWGQVGVQIYGGVGTNGMLLQNIELSGAPGANLYDAQGIYDTFVNLGAGAVANGISIPVELDTVNWTRFEAPALQSDNTGMGGCPTGNCPAVSYPYALHCSAVPSSLTPYPNTCGGVIINNLRVIRGGIKVDTNDQSSMQLEGPDVISGGFIEEPVWGGFTYDTRYSFSGNWPRMSNFYLQDPSISDSDTALFAFTDPVGPLSPMHYVLDNVGFPQFGLIGNKYFNGVSDQTLGANDNGAFFTPWPANGIGPTGTFTWNGVTRGEFDGQGFNGLESVPFGTLPVTQSPSGMTSACGSVCTGTAIQDPFGGQNGIDIAWSGTGANYFTIGTTSVATYPGDEFIFMEWARPGSGQSSPAGANGNTPPIYVTSWGSDTFTPQTCFAIPTSSACGSPYGMIIKSQEWSPYVANVIVGTGDSTAHTVNLEQWTGQLVSGVQQHAQVFCPQWAFIPGPNNPAYTGVSTYDIQLARMYSYHGCAPGGLAAGTQATSKPVSMPSLTIQGAPAGSYAKADGTGYGTPGGGIAQLTGDVTAGPGNGSVAASVVKINGGAAPTNAIVGGWNGSGQPVSTATTGSGNAVLATGPTIATPTVTGATTMQGNVTLENGANSSQTLAIQPGASADQTGAVQFNNYAGTSQWQLRKDASNYFRLTDSVNSLDRGVFYQNGNTMINAGAGSNAVVINNTNGSGTGGFMVYEGGTNSSTAALQVTGSGNTTATGFLQGKFMIGTGTMTLAAGAAAGTGPSIGCATSHVCDGVSGTVTLTTGTSTTTGTLATLGFPNTHTSQANCMLMTESASAVITTNTWSESTTAITITANAAPTASTAYTIKYWCGGN